MGRLSPQGALLFLMLLAILSWGIVLGQFALTGSVSVFAIANASVFTLALALWPLLAGAKGDANLRMPDPCRECGTMALPVPGIRFCLRCGAYPKARPMA